MRHALILCFLAACASSTTATASGDADAASGTAPGCSAGEIVCDGDVAQVCGDDGQLTPEETCPNACAPGLGCVVCVPGTGQCGNGQASACRPDGSGYDVVDCDPVQGMSCDPASGQCLGACSPRTLGTSYIGCDYYPVVMGNLVSNDYHFAVAIANTTTLAAKVTIEGGALTQPLVVEVAPGSVQVETLPWQIALKLVSGHTMEANTRPVAGALVQSAGAYHLRSSVPVTVYQFNPLEYQMAGAGDGASYTNDASLLLPTNVWQKDYYTAAWQAINRANPSEMEVVARVDGTHVTVTSKAATVAAGGAPAFQIGQAQTVVLDAGGVLELTSLDGDFTGTRVTADQPVEVMGGHFCAKVPEAVPFCDHLEESMIPVASLGRRYVVNAAVLPSMPDGKVEVIRVIATAPGTTVSYSPAQAGAPTVLAAAGDFIELSGNKASFVIEADQKILVAQYMEGQEAGGGTGDPAMAIAVPVDQFRSSYLFHAPINYLTNYVDVTAPSGAAVQVDGASVAFTPIGTTGFGLGRVSLGAGPGGDGNHAVTSDVGVGISVYGYGTYTSYWYPGGLDLHEIIVQ